MGNVYLVKVNDRVRHFLSETEMQAAGFLQADKIVSDEDFNSNGCYARIINSDIVVGRTEKEKQKQSVLDQIADIEGQLETLDKEYLTPRILRGLSSNDEYAVKEAEKHEAQAAPLREDWKKLKAQLDALAIE